MEIDEKKLAVHDRQDANADDLVRARVQGLDDQIVMHLVTLPVVQPVEKNLPFAVGADLAASVVRHAGPHKPLG